MFHKINCVFFPHIENRINYFFGKNKQTNKNGVPWVKFKGYGMDSSLSNFVFMVNFVGYALLNF